MTTTHKELVQTRDVFTGSDDASVTLVCFMDYESPECAKLNKVLNELLSVYEGKLRVNIRHFPMANRHQKAMKAAEAAVCAAQEHLFWQMNNILFENQKKLGVISLAQYAKEIGSKNKRFLDEVINGVYAWQVREDLLEGVDMGIRTVPAVFVNGKAFEEDLDLETLSGAIGELI